VLLDRLVLPDRFERLLDRLLEDDLPLFFPDRDRDLDLFFDFFLFFLRLLDLGCQAIKNKIIPHNGCNLYSTAPLLLQGSLREAILT